MKECFEGETSFYMIIDLLKGNTLTNYLLRKYYRNPAPEDDIRVIMKVNKYNKLYFKQILEGIKYIHQKDIIHRDLKPDNIMFQTQNDLNSLKIVDFGLATKSTEEKFQFPKCGTPGYVAPEIANLEKNIYKYSNKCDIFSIGVIMFKL